MYRPLSIQDFLMIGGVAGVIITCLILVILTSPLGRKWLRRRRSRRMPTMRSSADY
jgi:hypothetical protein